MSSVRQAILSCLVMAVLAAVGACVPAPECMSDDDCGACALCVGGACQGTGEVSCTSDADCGADQVCQVDPDDPCANTCAAAPAGCDAPACTSDADCAAGEVCAVDDADPCANACVAADPSDAVGGTQDDGSDCSGAQPSGVLTS